MRDEDFRRAFTVTADLTLDTVIGFSNVDPENELAMKADLDNLMRLDEAFPDDIPRAAYLYKYHALGRAKLLAAADQIIEREA